MKIALAQLNPTVGAFETNALKIEAYLREADQQNCHIMVTPELALSGYPPQDLLLYNSFQKKHDEVLSKLVRATKSYKTHLVLGCFSAEKKGAGKGLANTALWIAEGKIRERRTKTFLPTYDVFDEARYFRPATENDSVKQLKKSWSVAICEDLWGTDPQHSESYAADPFRSQRKKKPDVILTLNASPYTVHKHSDRRQTASRLARSLRAPLIYVNQCTAVDHLIFDGKSFVLDAQGRCLLQAPAFEECLLTVDLENPPKVFVPRDSEALEETLEAIVFGIREYVRRSGASGIVLGLSGGIDSALVATLAVRALGSKAVHAIAMPGPFNSPISLEDAETLAHRLGIHFHVKSIVPMLETSTQAFQADDPDLESHRAYENLQSRLRGVLLMTYSNKHNLLVLNTGNKSEIATGYCTLYGDTNGAISPIGDLLKTQVYEAARLINQERELIPDRIITRAPSAELRPDQTDQQTLPPYPVLDSIIDGYVVQELSAAQIAKKNHLDPTLVLRWIRNIEAAEFKRRQLPFPIRISSRGFDSGRRIPITKEWPS